MRGLSGKVLEVDIEGFGINRMSEVIPLELQISAVVLAQELKFSAAAEKLGISPAILRA